MLKLNFACVEFPSIGMSDKSKLDFQILSPSITWKLSYLENASESSPLVEDLKITTISNGLEESDNGNEPFKSVLEISKSPPEDNKSETVKFIAYGGENEGEYRTTIFVNHTPLQISPNSNFIDHKIKKNEKVVYEFEMNDEDLQGISTIYAISVDLKSSLENEQPQIEVFKTDSVVFNASSFDPTTREP